MALAAGRLFAIAAGPLARRYSPVEAVAEVLRSLTEQLLRISSELRQIRVTYYFQNDSPDLSLARQMPCVLAKDHLLDRVTDSQRPGETPQDAISKLFRSVGARHCRPVSRHSNRRVATAFASRLSSFVSTITVASAAASRRKAARRPSGVP